MTSPDTIAADLPPRTNWWSAIRLSIAVTAAAAVFAYVLQLVADTDWSYVFVITRWMVVFALLALPLAYQVAAKWGTRLPLPWAIRTPATALVLTIEGIAYDIISAHLRG